MEFDPPKNTNSAIPDAERIAAETRKKTLSPMNPFIKPEDVPDPIAFNTPQANIRQDTENTAQTESLLQPSTSVVASSSQTRSNKGRILLVALILIVPLAAIAFILMLPKTQ